MKTFFLIAITAFFMLPTQAQKTINDANAEVRSVSSFHGIHITNAFEVYLTQGNEESLAVSATDKEDVQHIETVVENGVLKIRYGKEKKWWGNKKLKAYISLKNINYLRASGACNIKMEGSLRAQTLKLHMSGAADFSGTLQIEEGLDANLSGASDINITGTAKNVAIDVSGASEVKAYDFTTATCTVEASGASGVRITVDKELSAKLSGASSVSYKGAAMIRDIKTSGASSISRKS